MFKRFNKLTESEFTALAGTDKFANMISNKFVTDDFDIYKFYTYYECSAEQEQHIRLLNSSGSAIASDYDYGLLVLQAATSFSELRATGQTYFRVINKIRKILC